MTLQRSLLLAVAIPIALAAAGPDALAQAPAPSSEAPIPSDQRALAETLFFTGRGLMEGGRIAQACVKFAESLRLDPAAGTLLNLAVCHEKEGKVASAWGEFRQALADARKANRPDREVLAKEAIARVEPDLPFVTITVPKEVRVPGLQIARNGGPLLEGGWDTELPIDPGTNEITATAPDYKPEKKTITIEKRQHVTVVIDPLVLAPIERPPPPFWTQKRKVGGAVAVGGAVLVGVGAVFGAMALSNRSKSDDNCPEFDGQRRCTSAGADAMSSAKTDAWVADIGVGLGAAAIIVGGYLFFTGGESQESGLAPRSATTASGKTATDAANGAWSVRWDAGQHGAMGFVTRSF